MNTGGSDVEHEIFKPHNTKGTRNYERVSREPLSISTKTSFVSKATAST